MWKRWEERLLLWNCIEYWYLLNKICNSTKYSTYFYCSFSSSPFLHLTCFLLSYFFSPQTKYSHQSRNNKIFSCFQKRAYQYLVLTIGVSILGLSIAFGSGALTSITSLAVSLFGTYFSGSGGLMGLWQDVAQPWKYKQGAFRNENWTFKNYFHKYKSITGLTKPGSFTLIKIPPIVSWSQVMHLKTHHESHKELNIIGIYLWKTSKSFIQCICSIRNVLDYPN